MNLLEDELCSLVLDNVEYQAKSFLELNDKKYQNLIKERSSFINKNHKVLNYLECNKPMQLSNEEHEVLIYYLEIENQINDLIKFAIYLYGHANGSAYQQITKKLLNTGS